MNKIIVLLAIISLVGCAAAGVVYTNDPYQKVSNSYTMMSHGRPIPAERFAKEALEQFKQDQDKYGQGEALVALGLLYKTGLMNKPQESIISFEQAINLFTSIDDFPSLAKTKFALGNAYASINNKEKQCALYSESLNDYEKGKELKPTATFKFNPAFSSFDAMVKAFQEKYCG